MWNIRSTYCTFELLQQLLFWDTAMNHDENDDSTKEIYIFRTNKIEETHIQCPLRVATDMYGMISPVYRKVKQWIAIIWNSLQQETHWGMETVVVIIKWQLHIFVIFF